MTASFVFEGMARLLCSGRRLGGRRALVALICGAAVSLMVLALTPHPAPFSPRNSHHGLRRIHQEDDDYTAPKPPAVDAKGGEAQPPPPADTTPADTAGPFNLPVLKQTETKDTGAGHVEEVVAGGQTSTNTRHQPTGDVARVRSGAAEHMLKAQETALSALQHGYRLTQGQRKLIDRMSPMEKKSMEKRVSKLRVMQEKAYLEQLRGKHQLVALPGGGERVISTPVQPVRFPSSLKTRHPKDWPQQQKIFQNMTHYPWPKYSTCSNFSNTFRPPGSLPTRALGSFPSSGNTWIRYLIEGATGIFTGSLYDDSSLTRRGMYGEGVPYDSGMTILQKSHGFTTGDAMKLSHEERLTRNHMEELSHQGVLVVRNPFKALISHRHLDVGGHTGYAPKAHFHGAGWAEFVTLKIGLWKDFYIDWLNNSEPQDIHIIHYEVLKKDPVAAMRAVLAYLGLPQDDARMRCLGQNTDGLFKRKPPKDTSLDLNPYTRDLKDLIYAAIDEVNGALAAKGKAPLPLQDYELYDAREAQAARRAATPTHNT